MSNLIANPELARKYLDIALRNNSFREFLLGFSLYELNVKDSQGNNVFSAMHVMEAIYDKYKSDPNSGIEKLTYETMLNELKTNRFSKAILNLFEDITYQISAQKNQTAPFNLDCLTLLEEAKENLKRNELFYKYPQGENKPNGIWPELEMYNNRIEQTIGRKIM